MHIFGLHAADLIHEASNAVATGQTVTDIKFNVHAHPTLSEVRAGIAFRVQGLAVVLPLSCRQSADWWTRQRDCHLLYNADAVVQSCSGHAESGPTMRPLRTIEFKICPAYRRPQVLDEVFKGANHLLLKSARHLHVVARRSWTRCSRARTWSTSPRCRRQPPRRQRWDAQYSSAQLFFAVMHS